MGKKHKITQQEKNEIRRQAFSSVQGKIRRLNNDISRLMSENNRIEEHNRKLAQENSRLYNKVIELESKLALLQETLNLSDSELQERSDKAETLYRYTNMLTPLLGGIVTKNTMESIENTLDAIQ